jgi:hypothetical protein
MAPAMAMIAFEQLLVVLRMGKDASPSLPSAVSRAVRQIPSMLGMRLRSLRSGPLDAVVTLATFASYLVPVVGAPAWTASNGRATRRLAHRAIDFYALSPASTEIHPFAVPARP